MGSSKKIPITGWTFVAGWLAICGIVPFAGFFSKDEILWKTWSASMGGAPWLPKLLWVIGFLTAGLTALYMTRLVTVTFFGKVAAVERKTSHPRVALDHDLPARGARAGIALRRVPRDAGVPRARSQSIRSR
ncbi:MAG: proton-conducting transporter membrane subunit [Candidatus Eisenbacteria bacterium]